MLCFDGVSGGLCWEDVDGCCSDGSVFVGGRQSVDLLLLLFRSSLCDF